MSPYLKWLKKYSPVKKILRWKKDFSAAPLDDGLKKDQVKRKQDKIEIDIIVCVHNALEDVQRCLESLSAKTSLPYKLVIVNDGSNAATATYLQVFAAYHKDNCSLIENKRAKGYTYAANQGMRATNGDYVVLLNSDTEVPAGWLEPLISLGESDAAIGILGPLSNAATYQSVPLVRDHDRKWAFNELPQEFTVDQMADLVALLTDCRRPRVPFLNGFCYIIKREVIRRIGYFDESAFPRGYGEENDYSIRAGKAGFSLALADDVYVYHSRSKSFTDQGRQKLSRAGRRTLNNKHGADFLLRGIALMETKSALLDGLRSRILAYLDNPGELTRPINILWLLVGHGKGGGGAHSVVQEAAAMNQLPGVKAKVAIRQEEAAKCLEIYHDFPLDTFHFYENDQALLDYSLNFDVAVATYYKTFTLMERICDHSNLAVMPAYYIQDYEPWFFPAMTDQYKEALRTYTARPETLLFAKSDFLCKTVKDMHGVKVHKVIPSLDTDLYHYRKRRSETEGKPIHITAMVRPRTARRAPAETMTLLGKAKELFGDRIKITIFGCDSNNSQFKKLPRDFKFDNRGELKRKDVADLFAGADIFVDMSHYQAFGLTAIEAMAMGCAVIVPEKGGVYEFASHDHNALIVDTGKPEVAMAALEKLVEDDKLRRRLAANATAVTEHFNLRVAAWSQVDLMRRALSGHREKNSVESL